jgi:Na+/H+-dicarboxylate symporter
MNNRLLIKVFLAIALAVIAGLLSGPDSFAVKVFDLLGKLFLNALTLVVVPLVASSIITGSAKMGTEEAFEKLGGKTFFYFIFNTFLAAVVGLIIVMIIQPGVSSNASSLPSVINDTQLQQIKNLADGNMFEQFANILLKIVPSNILQVASQGQMLGLIFFSLLFGFFISKIEPHSGSVILHFWKAVFQIMMKITHLVMRALPIGVFGLVAKVVATTGSDSISSVAWFSLTITLGLFAYAFVILPLLIIFIGKENPVKYFKAMAPAIFTALSTSSSAATLPVTIDCMEKRVGVSNRISSFTLPLGTSLNCAGTALYAVVATIYIAESYGIELGITTLFTILMMSFLTSFGMAGIPSASLVSIVVILNSLGIPAEGIGLVLAVERLVDMMRTAVNVYGNSCSTLFIAKSEGETVLA